MILAALLNVNEEHSMPKISLCLSTKESNKSGQDEFDQSSFLKIVAKFFCVIDDVVVVVVAVVVVVVFAVAVAVIVFVAVFNLCGLVCY